MAKDKSVQMENFSLTKTGTFYKYGGRHYGGKIVCDNGEEFVVATNPDVSSESKVEFSLTDNGVKIEKVLSAEIFKLTGCLIRTPGGDVKFVEKNLKGLGRQYTLTNDKNSNLVRDAFGKIVNVNVIDKNLCTIDKVYDIMGSLRGEAEAVVDRVNMSQNWSTKALAELEKIPEEVDISTINLMNYEANEPLDSKNYDPSKPNYYDFRDKLICTIDPDDCQDMDDAVYTEIDENGNYITYAAIADVTEYINPKKTPHLWGQAQERAMSLYYMFGAQDMLPHKIASGICSLNEGEDRLTMCVKTTISPSGKRIKKEIIHAVINSKKKYSYQQVQKMLDDEPDLIEKSYAFAVDTAKREGKTYKPTDLAEAIFLNKKVGDALKKERSKRESLVFQSSKEPKMILSEDGKKVEGVKAVEYLPSMGMIEALMVNANEAVAETLNAITEFGMYRVHGKPNDYKVEKLNAVLEHFGVKGHWDGSKQKLKKIVEELKGNENEDIISAIVVTCLDRAKYSVFPHPYDPSTGEVMTEEKCHSALDSDFYSHFTSGIRRFPDLIAQYMLKIHEREGRLTFDENYLKNVAAHVTAREKELDDAEKEIKDLGFAAYAEGHINDVVKGRICEIDGDKAIAVVLTDNRMRINVPISEFFRSGRNTDKFQITDYGIAVIKDGEEVISLGKEVECKICGSNRVMREVYGSRDLQKTFAKVEHIESADVAYRAVENKLNQDLEKQISKVIKYGDEKQRVLDKRNLRNGKNGKNGRNKK